ncbi:MAG: M64 family metallopeptidase [Polyangiaceae bacterium]
MIRRIARTARAAAVLGALTASLLAAPRVARAACPDTAGDCSSLAETGSFGASFDVVIVGDGYTQAERDKFFADAQTAANNLLESETYRDYKPVINVWALYTPSNESGADDPSENKFVDTAYDASFDSFGIYYLLAVTEAKVVADVVSRFPEADLTLCIVNDLQYGGSGGDVAVVSLDPQSIDIARHEIGHTIADLADEYPDPYPGYPDGDSEPNVASTAHLDPLKWAPWLDAGVAIPTPIDAATGQHSPIGAYEGARYKATGMFRPAPTCLMRELASTFCPVCAEAVVKALSDQTLLIEAPFPAGPITTLDDVPVDFGATIAGLADLEITWAVDGTPRATTPGFTLLASDIGLAPGSHEVTLTVHDATPLVRNDPDGVMTESFSWALDVQHVDGSGGAGGVAGAGGQAGGGGAAGADSDDGCGCRAPSSDARGAGWFGVALAGLALYGRRRANLRRRTRA